MRERQEINTRKALARSVAAMAEAERKLAEVSQDPWALHGQAFDLHVERDYWGACVAMNRHRLADLVGPEAAAQAVETFKAANKGGQ